MEDFETYTITGKPLKSHEYVVVKRVLTAGDSAWIKNQLIKQQPGVRVKKDDVQLQAALGDVELARLERMIVRWQLTRTVTASNGVKSQVPIELSNQAIRNLPAKITDHILAVMDKLDDEEEEDDEDFLPGANGHSEESLKPTNLFPMNT